jgi:hypothetical protein
VNETGRVFTITPGRSGIHYLTKLLRVCSPDLPHSATPEYFPKRVGLQDYFESGRHEGVAKNTRFVKENFNKLPENYVCTSLLPKNGYLFPLFQHGARFISLERDISDNAYSWYKMNGAPGLSPRGFAYHPCIESDLNCLNVREHSSCLTPYQKCVWLCLETRARAQWLAEMGADVYFVGLTDLNHPSCVAELFEWLGADFTLDNLHTVLGHRLNSMVNANRTLQEKPDIEERIRRQQELEMKDFLVPNKKDVRI